MKRLVLPEVAADTGTLVPEVGEVEPGKVTSELVSGLVVSEGGFFGGVEGTEPKARAVLGESDFGDPFSPMTLPDASV